MAIDERFEPRLGKIGNSGAKGGRSFRSNVLHATARSGGLKRLGAGALKRGRGAGIARVASSRRGDRRVIVKGRYIKLAGKGLAAAAAHLKYIQRDGVTREGERGQLYGADTDRADGKAFMERSTGDARQFRFIVSPEDGPQYDDLQPLTRKLMAQMESDLGTKLDWVAVDHFNTGHPHSHIVIRGRDDKGGDLEIAKEYISEGFRARAMAQVTLDLGPASDLEITARLNGEVYRTGFTSIDRNFLREVDEQGIVQGGHRNPKVSARRVGRLVQLREFGLVDDLGGGQWRLHEDLEPTLRRMGERGDIIKALHRDLKRRGLEHAGPDAIVHDQSAGTLPPKPLVGRVISRGLSDEYLDRHYLIVEATDGRVHYLDIGQGDRTPPLPREGVIRLARRQADLRPADHTIARVAAANEGRYDVAAHLKFDRNARQSFAETHVRRLEAIRRVTGKLDRQPNGAFEIGPDYLDIARQYESKEIARAPLTIDVLAVKAPADQVRHVGVTWLDKTLFDAPDDSLATAGFGNAVRTSLQLRQQWLIAEGLAIDRNGQFVPAADMITNLKNRELATIGSALTQETGLAYTDVRPGQHVSGRLERKIQVGDEIYGILERSRDFALVPWRPVLEKQIGHEISGLVRESGINWTIGRDKGLEIE